jgi:hypothetical protein
VVVKSIKPLGINAVVPAYLPIAILLDAEVLAPPAKRPKKLL